MKWISLNVFMNILFSALITTCTWNILVNTESSEGALCDCKTPQSTKMEQMNVSVPETQGGSSNPEHVLVNNTYKWPKILKPAACWGRWGSNPDSLVNKVWEFNGKKCTKQQEHATSCHSQRETQQVSHRRKSRLTKTRWNQSGLGGQSETTETMKNWIN